jgi:hypothetical protein
VAESPQDKDPIPPVVESEGDKDVVLHANDPILHPK